MPSIHCFFRLPAFRVPVLRLPLLAFGAAAVALLSACGGGSDDGVGTGSSAGTKTPSAAANAADSSRQPTPRRARAYDAVGVTAVVVSRDGATVGVANADGSVALLNPAGKEI